MNNSKKKFACKSASNLIQKFLSLQDLKREIFTLIGQRTSFLSVRLPQLLDVVLDDQSTMRGEGWEGTLHNQLTIEV